MKMEAFKNFLKRKKVEKHFKDSGRGQRLESSSAAPSIVSGTAQGGAVDRVAASDIAAQAALKRIYKAEPHISSQRKKIQMIAQRELEEERRRQEPVVDLTQLHIENKSKTTDVQVLDHARFVEGVYFTCELLGEGEAMTKPELMQALEDFLTTQMLCEGEDAVVSAVLLLYSLNKKRARDVAIETIGKYLQNIIEMPTEPKYRRIRLSNKAFQERVANVKGGREFLSAVGFKESVEPFKDGDEPEPFLVIPKNVTENTAALVTAMSLLKDGQSVPITVSRQTKVYRIGENEQILMPRLSPDFYDLTVDDMRREQQTKTEQVDKLTTLRTREMRERDEKQRQYSYKYTLIRVRLPDRYVLQGTFGCYESLASVREFIAKHLSSQTALFSLCNPTKTSESLVEDTKTLAELGLAPAVVLHLIWEDQTDGTSLSQEWLEKAVPLTTC